MKRLAFLVIAFVIIGSLFFTGCGSEEVMTTTSPEPGGTTSATPAPSTTAKSGGTMRVIYLDYPSNLSYVPEQNLADESFAKSYAETLIYWAGDGQFKPELAKSWEIDENNLTLTFHLQEGVTFQDGTPFNADAVMKNVQLLIDSQRLANGQYVDSISAPDEYTFVYHLNAMFTPQMMLHSYGYNLLTMFSPTALEQNGKDWCVTHFVSTGPFLFDSFERDVSMKMVRNPNYWRGAGYPYLDGIEFIFVADATIASTKMQAGEGDIASGLPLKESIDLENLGYTGIPQIGGFYTDLIPDTASADSVFADARVREAIEYAIDRDAIAAAVGYGRLHAVKSAGPEGTQGYDPNYQVREYNPQKAKDLLTAAGFPNGFKTTIYQLQGNTDETEAIQGFLAEVGITADIQAEDPGKFFGRIYGEGWPGGLLFFSSPIDPEFAIGWFVHFGPQPIFPYVSLKWPDGYTSLLENVRVAPTVDEMHQATQKLMTFVSDSGCVIPIHDTFNIFITADYVHTMKNLDHFMVWHTYLDWMEQ